MALLVACFTVSGATSLILQVVWARWLTEIFGSSSLAVATVLAAFMGGLALGASLGGRLADRLGRAAGRRLAQPLLGYAASEALVGLSALLIPVVLAAYRGLAPALWQGLSDSPTLLALCRLGLTGVALLVPTTAMGATLPLLGRHVTRQRADLGAVGRRLGGLYAANTTGALVGAAAAGFWLIPAIGVSATSHLAAAGALALASVVGLIAIRRPRTGTDLLATGVDDAGPAESPGDAPPAGETGDAPPAAGETGDAPPAAGETGDAPPAAGDPALMPRPTRALLLAAYATSGAVAMALEVFLSRALGIVLGSSVYSFTLVLVVFLAGLALGAAACARLAARTARPIALLAVLFLVLAGTTTASHLVLDHLPGILLALLEGTDLSIRTILVVHTVLAGLVILPIALGLGAVLPLVMHAYVGRLGAVGRDVGRAYAANTVGAIAGALLAGFLLLPHLGLEPGLRLCAAAQALLGALLVLSATRRRAAAADPAAPRSRPRARAAGLAAAVALTAAAAFAPGWNQSDFTAGLFRAHLISGYMDAGGLFQRKVVFYKDGVSTTVSVERTPRSWVLKNNGKVEASTQTDMPTQILVGLMPVFLHRAGHQKVFVVGYGSGVTVGAVTQSPRVNRIDVAELEPAVLEAADRFFADAAHHPAADPRVHRFLGDGRNVLLASGKRYDVIVSEPSNPWIAGVASLFTTDFYRLARRRLAPGGIFCQWAQLYELGPARVKMIYRSFHTAFPYVYAFTPGDETTDTILLGSLTPIPLDLGALDRRMADPTVRAELDRAFVNTPEDLAASLLLAPDEVASFTAGAALNTDDNARLEHTAPRDLLASVRENQFARAVHGTTWPYGHLDQVVSGLGPPGSPGAAARALTLATSLVAYGRRREAQTWLDQARSGGANPTATARLTLLLRLFEPVDYRDPELVVTAGGGGPLPGPAPGLFAGAAREPGRARTAAAQLAEGYRLIAEGRWAAAQERLGALPRRADTPAGRDVNLVVAYAAYKSVTYMVIGRRALLRLYQQPGFADRRPAVDYYLGRASYGVGAFRDGLHAMARFVDQHPALAHEVLGRRLPAGAP